MPEVLNTRLQFPNVHTPLISDHSRLSKLVLLCLSSKVLDIAIPGTVQETAFLSHGLVFEIVAFIPIVISWKPFPSTVDFLFHCNYWVARKIFSNKNNFELKPVPVWTFFKSKRNIVLFWKLFHSYFSDCEIYLKWSFPAKRKTHLVSTNGVFWLGKLHQEIPK